MKLHVSHFSEYFRAVHGYEPFPWQSDLVTRVVRGGWPEVIDVPTGLGKTAVLDVAVFTRALGLASAPRRIFLVIDRRVVVDQAYEHAQRIARALTRTWDTSSEVVQVVAQALKPPGCDIEPLAVGRMRGGVTWSWRWIERPDQCSIVVGTVDQLGSRLLFRGYGVGENLRSIDAALVGTDSLVILDEAHLAGPFRTSVQSALDLDSPIVALPLQQPTFVMMSATAGTVSASRHGISDRDRHDERAAVRLGSPKRLRLIEATVRKSSRDADVARVLANAAKLLAGEGADVVGVVANTVAVARAAFDLLRREAKSDGDGAESDRVVLMTGRQRPVDRELLWSRWRSRVEAGRSGHVGSPLFVVATQAIEVGADLDFGGLVAQSASIDAIVQRLGRLNRRGAWSSATAVVVHPVGAGDDPIYGASRDRTWEWLCELAEPVHVKASTKSPAGGGTDVDVSPGAISELMASVRDRLPAMRPEEPFVPVMFPWMLHAWAQTSPAPSHAPPVGPFLHGLDRDLPSVNLLWRATFGDEEAASLQRSLEELPAAAEEQVEVPLGAFRRWLGGADGSAHVADVDVIAGDTEPFIAGDMPDVPIVRVTGEGNECVVPGQVRPGDTLAVPSRVGGLDTYGWAPGSREPVWDVGDLAVRRGARSMRLGEWNISALLDREGLPAPLGDNNSGFFGAFSWDDPEASVSEVLRRLNTHLGRMDDVRGQFAGVVAQLSTAPRVELLIPENIDALSLDATSGPTLGGQPSSGPAILVRSRATGWQDDVSSAGSSASGVQRTMREHHDAVQARAREFCSSLDIPDDLTAVVVEAAVHHDLGKADPRFQSMLRGGTPAPQDPRQEVLLAKSGMSSLDRSAFRRAARLSGCPAGFRHEAFSALAVAAVVDRGPMDRLHRDLLVHLVASHHGRSRPLLPPVIDDAAEAYEVQVDGQAVSVKSIDGIDWDGPGRFERLNRHFGVWGLALLETIVRLADISCSEEGR